MVAATIASTPTSHSRSVSLSLSGFLLRGTHVIPLPTYTCTHIHKMEVLVLYSYIYLVPTPCEKY